MDVLTTGAIEPGGSKLESRLIAVKGEHLLDRSLAIAAAAGDLRPPQVLQTIYTSIIDRTLIVLWRAVVMAAPAGAVIWLSSNIYIGDLSIASHLVNFLNPVGLVLGLNGVILVAYIVAIPANEIIIPTILMLTLTLGVNTVGAQAGVMLELDPGQTHAILTEVGGWSMLTAINLMLFSLLHNPCSTTIMTIWTSILYRS